MPYVVRKRTLPRLGRIFLIMAGLVAIGGFWWWLTSLGPRSAIGDDDAMPDVRREDPAWAQQRERVTQLLQEAMAARPGGDEDLLAEARALQETVVAASGGASQTALERLAQLDRLLAEARARSTERQIQSLEESAATALRDGREDAAAEAWRTALVKQRDINRSAAGAQAKNFLRGSQLELSLAELAAKPVAREVDSALAAAREALEVEDWALALAGFTAAKEGQLRINREFTKTRYADTLKLGTIERELASLDAAGLAQEVDELEARGDAATSASDAAEAYAEAVELQTRLNQEFAKSRFLSSARVDALETKRQTAASRPRLEELRELEQRLSRHLARREVTVASALIEEADGRIAALFEQLPKSSVLDADLRLKLGYLAAQRERLAEVQDAVLERLRPLPGVAELWLLQTEVPQALYLQVMRSNPSRHPGRAFPVDSVNWFEAQQFCRRLGWLLGRPVRLPTRDEFRIALGDAAEMRAGLAAAEMGGGPKTESRAMAAGRANAGGFFDLLGNLAEWLAAPADERGSEPAPIAGGSYLDAAEVLAAVPEEARPRSDRARHIGFRFVVEMDLPEADGPAR